MPSIEIPGSPWDIRVTCAKDDEYQITSIIGDVFFNDYPVFTYAFSEEEIGDRNWWDRDEELDTDLVSKKFAEKLRGLING